MQVCVSAIYGFNNEKKTPISHFNIDALTFFEEFRLNLFGSRGTCICAHVLIRKVDIWAAVSALARIFRHNLSGTTAVTERRQLAIL